MSAGIAPSIAPLPGELEDLVQQALDRAIAGDWVERIWRKDATLWAADASTQEAIGRRLGWLHVPEVFLDRVDELEAFAAEIRAEGFTQAVLCGMGGSSLAPYVLARAMNRGDDGMPVTVLDSTDPEAVRAVREQCDPRTTLFLIASKSGTTTETLAFLAYFWESEHEVQHRARGDRPGLHFVAISDPGHAVESIPHSEDFRGVFLNPPDVGGRYSALTYVGLVPAALLGLDLGALLTGGTVMAQRCRADGRDNPGLMLGLAIGSLARAGRDKLTLLVDPVLAPFGSWVEQLLAESTGKQGTGIVPVVDEPVGAADSYGRDRAFVRLLTEAGDEPRSEWRRASDALAAALTAGGHPVIDLHVEPGGGLGGEFVRWEFATAVAGAVLGIDPFDEPNVGESKEATRRILAGFAESGALPDQPVLASDDRLTLVGDQALRLTSGSGSVVGELHRHLERLRPASYLALQAYLAPTPERDALLADLRALLRDRSGHATTAAYGPRFLHSTGQLHKGGAPIGWFLQLVAGHPQDVAVPDARHTFGTLIDAQALGDFAALERRELPALRVHLSDDPDVGLAALRERLEAAL